MELISSALNAVWRKISAFKYESRLVKLVSSEERENGKKRKVEYLDKIPVSGKTPKTPEKSKN